MKKNILVASLCALTIIATGCQKDIDRTKVKEEVQTSNSLTVENQNTSLTAKEMRKNLKYTGIITDEDLKLIYPDTEIRNYVKTFMGQTMPTFTYIDTKGKEYDLADLKGEKYIVEFMGTWCSSCEESASHIEEFMRENPEVKVLSMSFSDSKADIEAFKKKVGITSEVYRTNISDEEFQSYFELNFVPAFFFVDEEMTINFVHVGDVTSDFLQDLSNNAFIVDENSKDEVIIAKKKASF